MTQAQLTPSGAPRSTRTLTSIITEMINVIDAADGQVTAHVDELGLELEQKAQAYAAVIRQLKAEQEAMSELADTYKQVAAVRENQITALKFRMEQALEAVGVEKLKTPTATWYFQNSTSVAVADENTFLGAAEDRFVSVKQYVNKTAIKDAIEAGEVVEGAELKTSRSLRFR